nr:uncharacterized mitochondrial protein AtMg00810-like [Tanacetum cinerariifolium]
MNEDYYHEQNSCNDSNSIGFDQSQPPKYTVNHLIFNAHNDFLNSQNNLIIAQNEIIIAQNEIMEQMTSLTSMCEIACQIVQKKQEEKRIEEEQATKAQNWKLLVCYDDDDDEERSNSLKDNIISGLPPCVAITPNEPVDSLSMGDEHLDTILAKESDKFIKSSVENLVPNPSESEGASECDLPACEAFTTFSNVLFDTDYDFYSSDDHSFSDEDFLKEIYSNPLFDEEIIHMKTDPHPFNDDSDLIESMLNHDSSIIISSKIDSLFDEFAGELTLLKSIPMRINETDCHPEEETHFTKRLLYDNSSPRPPEEFVYDNSDVDIESFSPSPIPIKDSDSLMEEIDLSFTPDDLMPSGIEEDDYESERDIPILEELLDNYSLSLPENKSYHFDIPSSSRPPAKPPDVDKKGGSYSVVAPRLELGKFNKWKKHMLCYLMGMEPYYIQCIKDGPLKPKTAKGPSDTKENRIIDLKLEYQTFRAKPSKILSQTYTRYNIMVNELTNDGVTMYKHEINVGFMNSLVEKWLSFYRELRNANHTQTLDLANYMGERDDKEISICQEKYTRDLLKKYEISDSALVKTPMLPLNNLGPDLAGKPVLYRGMIGFLMYLTTSRPDIQFLICLCVRYEANPKESHLIDVKRIFRYLKGTSSIGMWYPKCSGFDLKRYSNSDYVGCNMDKKSTLDTCQILGRKLVCYSAKKQHSTAMSFFRLISSGQAAHPQDTEGFTQPVVKGFHSPLDEGTHSSKPFPEGKPTDHKDSEKNKQPTDMGLPATHLNKGISITQPLHEETNINTKDSKRLKPLADRDSSTTVLVVKYQMDSEPMVITAVADIQALLGAFNDELQDASDDDVFEAGKEMDKDIQEPDA